LPSQAIAPSAFRSDRRAVAGDIDYVVLVRSRDVAHD
jgi:hypothetical protein